MDFTELWLQYGEYLKALLVIVIGYLVSGGEPTGLVKLIQWLKMLLKLSGRYAAILKWVLSLVTAVIIAWINGQLDFAEMTPEVFLVLLTTIATATEYWYKKLLEAGALRVRD